MSITQLPITVDGARQLLTYSRESADRLLALFGQEEDIIRWAEQHGYEIAGHARDNRVSGVVPADDREGLSAALTGLQHRSIAGLVVSHPDRLARDVNVMTRTVERIWDEARDLFTVWLPKRLAGWRHLIPRTLEGLEFCKEVARAAALELETLQHRLQGARRRKAARGGYVGGNRRYGVEPARVNGTLEYRPVAEEQQVIRWVCNAHDGGLGYKRIARYLNETGIASATGAPWAPKVVRGLIERGPDGGSDVSVSVPPVAGSVGRVSA